MQQDRTNQILSVTDVRINKNYSYTWFTYSMTSNPSWPLYAQVAVHRAVVLFLKVLITRRLARRSPFASPQGRKLYCCFLFRIRATHACIHAEKLVDSNNLNDFKLWHDVHEYYDMPKQRANNIFYEVQRLIGLRLDASTRGTKFVTDFQECLLQLGRTKAALEHHNDVLRALLLVAIKDKKFELVPEDIVNNPTKDIHKVLFSIRKREASAGFRDSNIRVDCTPPSSISRRVKRDAGPIEGLAAIVPHCLQWPSGIFLSSRDPGK